MSQSHVQPSAAAPANAFERAAAPPVRFAQLDPEARLGLPVGAFTTPHLLTSLLLALVAMAVVYGVAWLFRQGIVGAVVWQQLTGFGRIPIPVAFLSLWSLSILLLKWRKIAAQRRVLSVPFMPEDSGFVLSTETASRVVETIESSVDAPERFVLFGRVLVALKAVRNMGRIGDIDDILDSQAAHDEATMDGGYTIVRGFIWAIPVLGFIGTVIGLTQAIGHFGTILNPGGSAEAAPSAAGPTVQELTRQLSLVIAGLDTAFVTTGQALVAALVIHLLLTFVRRADERLLDDVRRLCMVQVVGRVRLLPPAGGA